MAQMLPQALHTDFYQITMAAAYHAQGMNGEATFSLFAHDLPAARGFMVAVGIKEVLDFLESFGFTSEELAYLESLDRFSPDFIDFLAKMSFTGEAWTVPEGTVCFGGEPMVEITAPLIQAQLVETRLINILNVNSTLASKAARCVIAAEGRTCVDFSLRRTMGLEAGLAVARSSAIVGFQGTSNVAAAQRFGLPPVGTMAHSFVEAAGDETQAFRAFAQTFPQHTVLLVDTYQTGSGLKHAIEVAQELKAQGFDLGGVRLDSGDLVAMSLEARAMLDAAGLTEAKVVVSGNLDEERIQDLVRAGARVDIFGIGTRMGSSADAPYLDLAYKLVNYQGRPTLKLSSGKETWAAAKQVWRFLDERGKIDHDLLAIRGEEHAGQPLLQCMMKDGRRTSRRTNWRDAKECYGAGLATLPQECLDISSPAQAPVRASRSLQDLQAKAKDAALGE